MESKHFDSVRLEELRSRSLRPDDGNLPPVVLVVDDERVIADTLALILSESGYAAMAAYDAEGAIETAELVPPDLLITDVVMPGMNGVDLAGVFREHWPTCRILVFSGQAATTELWDEVGRLGHGLDVLAKPVHPANLLVHIQQLMHSPS